MCGLVFVRRYRKDEAKGILPVQVETIKSLLADESQGLVKSKSSDIVVFGLQKDLTRLMEFRNI